MDDAYYLIEAAGVTYLTGGWHTSIRADYVDVTPQRPHGLNYGLVLNDPDGNRVLGFDNSHGYEGASPEEPFDHEHKFNKPWKTHKYEYKSAVHIIADFYERIDAFISSYRERTGVELRFLECGDEQ